MAETRTFAVESPVVNLTVTATQHAVTEIRFGKRSQRAAETPFERKVGRELEAYFAGRRTAFSFRLAPQGTPFAQRVWRALLAIPYGETRTYGEIAARLGKPGAARAVGTATAASRRPKTCMPIEQSSPS